MPVNLHLVCGSDDYLAEQQARAIVDATVPTAERVLGLEILDGRVDTKDAAVAVIRQCLESVQTAGFFGGGKLVWLRNATFLNPQSRPGDSEDVKARVAELVTLLKGGLPAGQRLLITAVSVARNTAFFKACQATGEVSDFGSGEKPWDQEKLARERLDGLLQDAGLEMPEEVRDRFLQRVGTSTRLLAVEAMAWDLTDALGDRDPARLVAALRRLEAQDENAIGLVTMAERRIREMLILRQAIDQRWLQVRDSDRGVFCQWGDPLPEEADRMLQSLPKDPRKTAPFILRRTSAQAKRYTLQELRRARHLLIELRERLVSSSAPPDILLETTLLRIIGLHPAIAAAR